MLAFLVPPDSFPTSVASLLVSRAVTATKLLRLAALTAHSALQESTAMRLLATPCVSLAFPDSFPTLVASLLVSRAATATKLLRLAALNASSALQENTAITLLVTQFANLALPVHRLIESTHIRFALVSNLSPLGKSEIVLTLTAPHFRQVCMRIPPAQFGALLAVPATLLRCLVRLHACCAASANTLMRTRVSLVRGPTISSLPCTV